MTPTYIVRALVVRGVSEANRDGRWSKFAQSIDANRVLAFSFCI
jgi:hypothetical protein